MGTWLAPKEAAQHIRKNNSTTMIGEKTICDLISQGFPCLKISTRSLINVDTLEEEVQEFSKKHCFQETQPTSVNWIKRIPGR